MNAFRKLRAFCRVLRMNKNWRFGDDRAIRARVSPGYRDFCPLTWAAYVAAGEKLDVGRCHRAAEVLGFEGSEGKEIARAADCTHGDDTQLQLRRILEKACGLR